MQPLTAAALCVALIVASASLIHVIALHRSIAGNARRSQAGLSAYRQRANAQLDSLLQNFQGLTYRIQAVADTLPQTDPRKAILLRILDDADALITGARSPASGPELLKIAEAPLEELLRRVASRWSRQSHKRFTASIKGVSLPLRPEAREALARIGEEALNNAYRHSLATRIELELVYDAPRRLIMRVRDNGRGFDVRSATSGLRHGNLGLVGIQERARWLHTQADVWSSADAGTEVSVCVPGADAYVMRPSSGIKEWCARTGAALRASD